MPPVQTPTRPPRVNAPAEPPKDRSAGLASYAATAAFGSSRALTSHVRSFYLRCYNGRCRYPRITFFIDATLSAAVLILAAVISWFALAPPPTSSLAISFEAPSLQAAAITPVAVTIRATDHKTHHNVRVRWNLPSGVELLTSDPHPADDGWAYIGDITPASAATIHATMRIFVATGSKPAFGLSLSDGAIWSPEWSGTDQREVVGSAVTADIPEIFQVSDVASQGVVLPMRISNTSDQMVPSATLSFEATPSHPAERIALGDLAAGETRWLFIPLRQTSSSQAILQWTIGAASRDLARGSWKATIDEDAVFPTITSPLKSQSQKPTIISIEHIVEGESLLIVHPFLEQPVQMFPLSIGASEVTLPAAQTTQGSNHEWLAAPLVTKSDGSRVLGAARMGVMAATLPFAAQVRYMSSAGDQLGAGPNPPQAGIETRYWMFWTVGPMDADIEHLSVGADLSPGVTATGNISSADGGVFLANGKHVRWTLPRLGSANGSTAVFGFEISVTPSAKDVGNILPMISTSTAEADDIQTSTVFESVDGPQTTKLPEDQAMSGAGIVLPASE